MVVAEALEPLEEGEVVRLFARKVERGEWPSGVTARSGDQGEAVAVTTQSPGFITIKE